MSEVATAVRAVDIDGLTVSYRRRARPLRVLTDVSLHINPGEAYGLVGESGCGKTTVAMALMRYLPPNAIVESGRISFGGEDLLQLSESKLRRWRGDRMAMVYQDPGSALNPSVRIGNQIAEVYRHHRALGGSEALEASAAMLDRVRITDPTRVLRRYPHELSGGQQQRVMIAMALATDPDLLVLDEPTTGLDATVEAEVLDLVEQLRDEVNSSILFISHNLGIVARICERVGVLYAGRLIEEGSAQSLFAQPRHPYTLALLRCVPRLGMHKDTGRLDPIPGSLPPLGADLPGCVYADRCPIARPRCLTDPPPLYEIDGERSARCHYHEEVPGIPPSAAASPAPPVARNGGVLLRVDDVLKSYRQSGQDVTAVAGVSFEVRRGEIFGLVGESGSGKTSLAKCIVGLVEASQGRIQFDSTDITRPRRRDRDIRRKLQMIFQNPDTALNPRHAIRRILGRSLKLLAGLTGRRQQERLDELSASVRLEPRYLDVRPAALSGGLKQRVSIARSFAGTPSMVLCPRRVRAGSHPQSPRRPAANGGLVPLHLARPRRRPLPRRPDRRDVPRLAGRRRAGRRGLQSAAPPLHGSVALGHPDDRFRPSATADQTGGRATEPERPSLGMPVPYALPSLPRGRVQGAGTPLARGRAGAPVSLPHPACRAPRSAARRRREPGSSGARQSVRGPADRRA
jgi:peptide/nickel transport system ATP-binding protein